MRTFADKLDEALTLLEAAPVRVVYYDPDNWYVDDDKPFGIQVGMEAQRIADESGVRIASNKDLTLIAFVGDQVAGAVWTALGRQDGANVYDFDIAVDPSMRATGLTSSRVGPQLIDAALRDFKDRNQELRSEGDDPAYIRCWVINRKLAGYLEKHYGFEAEDQFWSQFRPFMVKYAD